MSRYDFGAIKQGDALTAYFKVQAPNGQAQDLTGATVTWTLSPAVTRVPYLTKTLSITDAEAGRCYLSVDTGDISQAGNFYHELEVVLASGESYTASDGTMLVEATARATT